ncbi:MAG: DUF342 domain-containing protein [Eubacterium sp.]|nr:DUF342 domain-containing protein [Lachnospiraceae bacterium]MBO5487345.1 DUF342 domain-containing protein [Eubacterium sp.]
MKNGYFQLVCGEKGTALKIIAPKEGGSHVFVREIMDYLNLQGIMYDTATLNAGLQNARNSDAEEYQFQINKDAVSEVRESYKLNVSQNKMTVMARFYAPSLKGGRMDADEFLRDLAGKNIVNGIKKEEIRKFFDSPEYCKDVFVAQGQLPRHGKDARIEYYFDTDLKAKPTLNSDGSVDFFHLNTICHCSKGDVLARLFPADTGAYGMTVYGEKVKPRDVKHAALKFGHNISISEDKQVLTAETDGHVTLVEGKVFVSNVFEVENVDISTGDIDYEGSVKINGNVCTNFTVRASGNIEVRGVVEGAYLEAGGDIIIARGMNGMARGVLKAQGNVISKFIENAKVSAGGYVSTESILHSEVMAGTEILVTGKRGFITGGRVSASNLVLVKTLGSSMGADTIVEVGIDPGIKVKIQQLQKQIADNRKNIEKIRPVLLAFKQKIAQGAKLKPEQLKNVQDMLQKEKQIQQDLETDTAELSSLQQMMEGSNQARIEVTGEVFAGTKICISDVSMVVKNSMSYCKFIKEHGDVKMAPL